MNSIRVLLVDDHAILRAGLRALLETYPDIEFVGEASDGNEAIDCVRKLTPDVVLIDVAMPGMNGMVATRYILEERPETRVIVLTQYGNREYVLPLLASGAAGYVLKQAADTDLIKAIRAVYGGESYLYPPVAKVLLESMVANELPTDPLACLTPRELDVLIMVAQAYSNREIADLLHVSPKTVDVHRSHMMEKLDLHHVVDVVRFAIRHKLLDVGPV